MRERFNNVLQTRKLVIVSFKNRTQGFPTMGSRRIGNYSLTAEYIIQVGVEKQKDVITICNQLEQHIIIQWMETNKIPMAAPVPKDGFHDLYFH